MVRCDSENKYSFKGLDWKAPDLSTICFHTNRLLIRSFKLSDADDLFDAIEQCRTERNPWMAWAEITHSEKTKTIQYLSTKILNAKNLETVTGAGLAIINKADGKLIGSTGVHDIRRDTASCDIGFWIHAGYRKRGFATEACRRTIDWALSPQEKGGLGLRRARLFCAKENAASVSVISKLGIRKEAEMKDERWTKGIGCTTVLGWGVMADDWKLTPL